MAGIGNCPGRKGGWVWPCILLCMGKTASLLGNQEIGQLHKWVFHKYIYQMLEYATSWLDPCSKGFNEFQNPIFLEDLPYSQNKSAKGWQENGVLPTYYIEVFQQITIYNLPLCRKEKSYAQQRAPFSFHQEFSWKLIKKLDFIPIIHITTTRLLEEQEVLIWFIQWCYQIWLEVHLPL